MARVALETSLRIGRQRSAQAIRAKYATRRRLQALDGRPSPKPPAKSKRKYPQKERPDSYGPKTISPEMGLWCAVVEQQISDLRRGIDVLKMASIQPDGRLKVRFTSGRAALAEGRAAAYWLLKPNPGRKHVLALLDIDQDWFVETLAKRFDMNAMERLLTIKPSDII